LAKNKITGDFDMGQERLRQMLTWFGALALLVFSLTPFLGMLLVAFASNINFINTGKFQFTVANFVNVLTSRSLHYWNYFGNSIIVATVTAITVIILTALAGYAIARLRFPGRLFIPLTILAMSMFPQISIIGYLYRFFANLGLLNYHIALILPYIAWTIPIALWINLSYFAGIPAEIDQAALIDRAGRVKILAKLIFPLALPGIFSALLLVFIACFNEFLFAIMLTFDDNAQTLPVGIAFFQGIHGEIPWGSLMAASALATVPLVILTLVFQKYVVQGLMGGALKG
jgi:multiple sugar transport system permease protein